MTLRFDTVFEQKFGEITKLEKDLANAEENHAWAVMKNKEGSQLHSQYTIDLFQEQVIRLQAQIKERINKCREIFPLGFEIRVLEKELEELNTVLKVGNKHLSLERKAEIRGFLYEKDARLKKLHLNGL